MANLRPELPGFDADCVLLFNTYSVPPATQYVLEKARNGGRFVEPESARLPESVCALIQSAVQRAKPVYAKETHEHIFGQA